MDVRRTRARLVAGLGSIVALFAVILAVDAAQTVPTTGLSAHWTFDTITSPSPDASGNNNTATLLNGPTLVDGLFSKALQFDGTNDYATVNGNAVASLDTGTNSFSVACWVKPNGTGVMRVMNKWSGTVGWHFDINAGAGGAAAVGNIRLHAKDNGGHDHDFFVAGGITSGAWYHIAGVYDRTNTPHKAYLYVNGVKKAERDITTLTGSLTNVTALQIATLGVTTPYFKGVMDEPVIYSARALTATEVQTLAAVPQNLTATNNQVGTVTLNWTAVPGAASYSILRSTTSGTGYALVTNVTAPATTFVDTPAPAGTYYYVIRANFTGNGGFSSVNSSQATGVCLPPQVTALPNSGLQTNENGATTFFTIKYNQPAPAGGSLLVVNSSDTSEGKVSTTYDSVPPSKTATATGFQVTVPAGTSPTLTVTITGQNDLTADGNVAFTVNVAAGGFTSLTIPPVGCTNNDNDTAGVTFSRTAGLATTEGGGIDTFTVVLNTQPVGDISMTLVSSNTAEGTVSPASIKFTNANWNVAQQVTITGKDDSALDFTVPYSILTGGLVPNLPADNVYATVATPDVSVVNVDDEVIPEPEHAWGGNGGGCGLTGLEAFLALALVAAVRKAKKQTV